MTADAQTVIAQTAGPILEFGRGWMSAPSTGARAVDLGFAPGFGFWVNGRAGAMGEVTKEAAAAAIGFMPEHAVHEFWDGRPDGLSAQRCAAEYADAAATWGREVLADVDAARLRRLTELSLRVATTADASIGALFAAWRVMPVPEDPGGGVTLTLQILRELRGGAHLSSVTAVGLGPHAAIMSVDDPVRGGVPGAERFGWSAPHPEGDPARRAQAEALTSQACEPAYAALDESEGAEFVDLVLEARAHLPA